MYTLLDIVENMMFEGCKDEKERQKLWQALYVPPSVPVSQVKDLPPGFAPEEEMSGFAALMGKQDS